MGTCELTGEFGCSLNYIEENCFLVYRVTVKYGFLNDIFDWQRGCQSFYLFIWRISELYISKHVVLACFNGLLR